MKKTPGTNAGGNNKAVRKNLTVCMVLGRMQLSVTSYTIIILQNCNKSIVFLKKYFFFIRIILKIRITQVYMKAFYAPFAVDFFYEDIGLAFFCHFT